MQLKITENQLKLAEINHLIPPQAESATPPPVSPLKFESVIAPSSTPAPSMQQCSTLEQLRGRKKAGANLPNNYLFSAKGIVEYEKLDLPEFVCGFLEFCKEQPEPSKAFLLKHLQLLMERAVTYSWSSVRNFHLSVNNAVEQGRLSWVSADGIRARAQTFSTHQDLRSAVSSSRPHVTSQTRPRTNKDNYCREWNYSGESTCNMSDASYKFSHRCRVCDSSDHAMLTCAKHKYPIPSASLSTPSPADQAS